MVLVLVRIRSGTKTLKPWLGIQVPKEKNIQELYNDFAAGALDSSSQIPTEYNSTRIKPAIGKSETDKMIPIDMMTTIGEATSIVGHYLDFNLEKLDDPEPSTSGNQPKSAFDILLKTARDKSCLPDKFSELNKRDKLKNDLIDWLQTSKVGWSYDQKSFLGKQFINTLSTALWEIDGNHKTLSDRGCPVPQQLSQFTGYNVPELRKKRRNTSDSLRESTLSANADSLLHLSGQAYMKCGEWGSVRECILTFATNLRKYCEYLKEQRQSTSKTVSKMTVAQNEREIWKTYQATIDLSQPQKEKYGSLHNVLMSTDFFEVICLNDFCPTEAWKKYEFLKSLVVPCKVMRFTYTGGMSNFDFLWRVPTSYDDASLLSKNIKIRDELTKKLPTYHTRAMKKLFFNLLELSWTM